MGKSAVYIYVGNLAGEIGDDNLRDLFRPFGEVTSAAVITDRFRCTPRGFGFVKMPNEEQADNAIKSLNATELSGRKIVVAQARERYDGPRLARGGSPPGE